MKKTRVPKGDLYWHIDGTIMDYAEGLEQDRYIDAERHRCGNYFHSKEECMAMARKLRAVLKGADVIEMPSEEEIKASQDKIEDEVVFNIRDANGSQLIYCTAINKGAELMAEWFKNKIVK